MSPSVTVPRSSSSLTQRLNSLRASGERCLGYFGRPPLKTEGAGGLTCVFVSCCQCSASLFFGRAIGGLLLQQASSYQTSADGSEVKLHYAADLCEVAILGVQPGNSFRCNLGLWHCYLLTRFFLAFLLA